MPGSDHDLEAALHYVIDNSAELDADPRRIAVMGQDAGATGCGSGPAIFRQRGSTDPHADPASADARQRRHAVAARVSAHTLDSTDPPSRGGHYLSGSAPVVNVPAHRADLVLPPTFISCSEIDPCRDEAIAYANRLLHAFVHTELLSRRRSTASMLLYRIGLSLKRTWLCTPCRCAVYSRCSGPRK